MKTLLIFLIVCICLTQFAFSQEDDGVVSLNLPVRNSLTFNRFIINPTFSFVREQNKYISIYNQREWVDFDDAPLTYLASYSGRFGENIGAGIALFQQNYGVLTTFGGTVNFAYNVSFTRDSNLTFGLNIGAYKSGVNTGNVVANFDDPSLQNVPENFLLSINPGINYGLAFFDVGVSVNNLALYNFESSELIEDNPQQTVQAHIMYTGYMDSRGFFEDSKFSGLMRSEFGQEETTVSAIAMLTVPKGIWAQVGYNTLYGVSGGIGLNMTQQIAIEYNYEKALGDLSNFGSSHNIAIAYRFKNNDYYDYSSGDEVAGLFDGNKKVFASKKPKAKTNTQTKLVTQQKEQEEADAKAKLIAEQKVQEEADAQAKLLADQKAQEEADAQAKLVAEQKAQEEADAQAKLIAEQKAQEEADAQAKLIAEQKAQEEADAQTKLIAEQKAQEELLANPNTEVGKAMYAIAKQTEASKKIQDDLLNQLKTITEVKNQDLKDLKEENDLSEQGIAVTAKPFKSISEENKRLTAIKANLDIAIAERNEKIKELKTLYEDNYDPDTILLDPVFMYYRKAINRLEAEQQAAMRIRSQLESRLEEINVATVFERNRRIKRAAFDNDDERYAQDRATLNNIKQSTPLSSTPLEADDFDFGEEQSSNIQILKDVKNVENGYYLIIAVHSDVEARNDFVTKVVASGRRDVDFFYDASTSKYYIYYKKLDTIQAANNALKEKGNKPYNTKMSLIKMEN